MIIYTPMPIELVMEGFGQRRRSEMVMLEGVPVEVEPLSLETGRIIRVFSFDPADYLRPQLQPGTVVQWVVKTGDKL